MTRYTLALTLAVMMSMTMACGVVNSLIGGSAGTTGSLWPDVPAFSGATKANLDLPLAAKLVVQTAFQGKLEFIAFTTTSSPQAVQAFYTADRMKATGWTTDTNGCTATSPSSDTSAGGALCFFGKKDGAKEYGLAIVAAQDDKTKATQIFYVRIDITSTPTPKP
jgi:hypothetical protein